MNNKSMLYFVHIPKTAGTSFRASVESRFGVSVVRDYGEKAPETSKIVKKIAYEANDNWRLLKELEGSRARFLCGHVPVSRYGAGVGSENTIAFVRDPVQRLYSEYQHFLRDGRFKGEFREFFSHRHRINQLGKYLDLVPVEALGVVGLTERYEESLEIINSRYGISLNPLAENTARPKLDQDYGISKEDRRELERLNQRDIWLYRRALYAFETRYSLFKKGLRFAHCQLTDISPRRIAGWAFWEGGTDEPVTVLVRVNGDIVRECFATLFRHTMCSWGVARSGYIGFACGAKLQPGDQVDCIVKETGQVFPHRPKTLPSAK